MKTKRSTAIILVVCFVFSLLTFTSLAEGDNNDVVDAVPKNPDETVSKLDLLPAREENVSMFMTRSSYVNITVNVPCDEEWRAQSNWWTLAKNAIEDADDLLWNSYSINFYSYDSQNWDSDDSNADVDLLNEAKSECGKNGKQYMIAFTGQTNCSYAGWGSVGQPYALVIDHGATNNKKVARHEIGHNYGMQHCTNSCFMNGTSSFYSNYDTICTSHDTHMSNHWDDYGTLH